MKKNPILLVMLMVLLALSMALVGCPNDSGGGGLNGQEEAFKQEMLDDYNAMSVAEKADFAAEAAAEGFPPDPNNWSDNDWKEIYKLFNPVTPPGGTTQTVKFTIKNDTSAKITHIKIFDGFDNDKVVYDKDIDVAVGATSIQISVDVVFDGGYFWLDFSIDREGIPAEGKPYWAGEGTSYALVWGGGQISEDESGTDPGTDPGIDPGTGGNYDYVKAMFQQQYDAYSGIPGVWDGMIDMYNQEYPDLNLPKTNPSQWSNAVWSRVAEIFDEE